MEQATNDYSAKYLRFVVALWFCLKWAPVDTNKNEYLNILDIYK